MMEQDDLNDRAFMMPMPMQSIANSNYASIGGNNY